MTLDEYHKYTGIASALFQYMNGYINQMNSRCTLYIDMYDNIRRTFATIRYPNYVVLHLGNIIDSWNDEWTPYMSKEEYITSSIAWAISHELHHADQAIQILVYNSNNQYKNEKEQDVQRASFDWVVRHKQELTKITGIRITLEGITSPSLPDYGHYRKATAAEFYKQSIANLILKDQQLFNSIDIFSKDTADDIILIFNIADRTDIEDELVVIKSFGKYSYDNIALFSDIVYRTTGFYDIYSIGMDIETLPKDGRTIAFVRFIISDRLYRPVVFRQ